MYRYHTKKHPDRRAWLYALLAVLILFGASFAFSTVDHPNESHHFFKVDLNNPYNVDVELEVKCDWNDEKKDFDFRRVIVVESKSSTTILFPRYYKHCQIWPSHSWF